jgi:hypothetical protein
MDGKIGVNVLSLVEGLDFELNVLNIKFLLCLVKWLTNIHLQIYLLSKHINSELADFDCDNLEFTLTTDGADYMLGISKGLKVSQYHCTAHILIILMSDGVSNVPDIMNPIIMCKDIVKALHWRGAE